MKKKPSFLTISIYPNFSLNEMKLNNKKKNIEIAGMFSY